MTEFPTMVELTLDLFELSTAVGKLRRPYTRGPEVMQRFHKVRNLRTEIHDGQLQLCFRHEVNVAIHASLS
jgi:hypothetical protein